MGSRLNSELPKVFASKERWLAISRSLGNE